MDIFSNLGILFFLFMKRAWSMIGGLLVLKTSRSAEFEADAFAVKLGYGYEICTFLDAVDSSEAEGIFACLSKSHPPKSQCNMILMVVLLLFDQRCYLSL